MADFMDTKTNKHIVFGIVLSCLLVYTFSMCLKMVYSASMVEIKAEYGVPHSIASLPITLYYVFYAVIQLFLAAIIKKINMKLYRVKRMTERMNQVIHSSFKGAIFNIIERCIKS